MCRCKQPALLGVGVTRRKVLDDIAPNQVNLVVAVGNRQFYSVATGLGVGKCRPAVYFLLAVGLAVSSIGGPVRSNCDLLVYAVFRNS